MQPTFAVTTATHLSGINKTYMIDLRHIRDVSGRDSKPSPAIGALIAVTYDIEFTAHVMLKGRRRHEAVI